MSRRNTNPGPGEIVCLLGSNGGGPGTIQPVNNHVRGVRWTWPGGAQDHLAVFQPNANPSIWRITNYTNFGDVFVSTPTQQTRPSTSSTDPSSIAVANTNIGKVVDLAIVSMGNNSVFVVTLNDCAMVREGTSFNRTKIFQSWWLGAPLPLDINFQYGHLTITIGRPVGVAPFKRWQAGDAARFYPGDLGFNGHRSVQGLRGATYYLQVDAKATTIGSVEFVRDATAISSAPAGGVVRDGYPPPEVILKQPRYLFGRMVVATNGIPAANDAPIFLPPEVFRLANMASHPNLVGFVDFCPLQHVVVMESHKRLDLILANHVAVPYARARREFMLPVFRQLLFVIAHLHTYQQQQREQATRENNYNRRMVVNHVDMRPCNVRYDERTRLPGTGMPNAALLKVKFLYTCPAPEMCIAPSASHSHWQQPAADHHHRYHAPETLHGVFLPTGDVYALGKTLMVPFYKDRLAPNHPLIAGAGGQARSVHEELAYTGQLSSSSSVNGEGHGRAPFLVAKLLVKMVRSDPYRRPSVAECLCVVRAIERGDLSVEV